MMNNLSKYKIKSIFVIILLFCCVFYVLNVNTIIDAIRSLSGKEFSVSKIDVTVFDDFNRYNYSLIEENGINEFVKKLEEIKIIRNDFGGMFNTKSYHNLHFENFLICLYEDSRLIGCIQIIREDVLIEGVTANCHNYKIVNYSNVNLEALYKLAVKYDNSQLQ